LLVAEIQQSSDTTYRLFDFNRLGPDGRPRQLHVEQALEAVDFGLGPIQPVEAAPTGRAHVVRLVDCDKFVLDRWILQSPQEIGGDERFHLLAVMEGQVQVGALPSPQAPERVLSTGDTLLLPAALGEARLTPLGFAKLLDIYLP
jgi:mannose-6-phosphate isomerase